MALTQTTLTLEEFLKLPEEEPPLEFEDGVVIQKVSPKAKHSTIQSEFIERINGFSGPGRIAKALPELRATFGGRSYVPDVAVYAWERLPADNTGEIVDDVFDPPDVAIEIVSPTQSVMALVRRCVWYVDNGVRIALLVDPADRSVVAFRLGRNPEALRETDRIDLSDVLPGFELTVQELFASLRIR
jgi:Uma2 family endonuclease